MADNSCDLCGDQPQIMHLYARCHLTAPLQASLERGVLTLRCYVPECSRVVATFAVAEVDHLQAIIKSLADRVAAQSEILSHRADKVSVRDLVIDIRRYALHHGVLLGECVAWEKLKKLVDVGQTADCPSEKGSGRG